MSTMSSTTLWTTTGTATVLDQDGVAGRLAEHLVAGALIRKGTEDPVPFPVWWRVTDALRASTLGQPAAAVAEVDSALASLLAALGRPTLAPAPTAPRHTDDPDADLRRAQALVAGLVFATTPTSPTLLHVRLVRLRRALVAAAAEE